MIGSHSTFLSSRKTLFPVGAMNGHNAGRNIHRRHFYMIGRFRLWSISMRSGTKKTLVSDPKNFAGSGTVVQATPRLFSISQFRNTETSLSRSLRVSR